MLVLVITQLAVGVSMRPKQMLRLLFYTSGKKWYETIHKKENTFFLNKFGTFEVPNKSWPHWSTESGHTSSSLLYGELNEKILTLPGHTWTTRMGWLSWAWLPSQVAELWLATPLKLTAWLINPYNTFFGVKMTRCGSIISWPNAERKITGI